MRWLWITGAKLGEAHDLSGVWRRHLWLMTWLTGRCSGRSPFLASLARTIAAERQVVRRTDGMIGPKPRGHWGAGWSGNPAEFNGLRRGRRYRVAKSFRDFDGDEHPEGEIWFFIGYSFLPYDDGLSLFVSMDGMQEWHIPMHWTSEDQGPIVDSLDRYVVPVDAG